MKPQNLLSILFLIVSLSLVSGTSLAQGFVDNEIAAAIWCKSADGKKKKCDDIDPGVKCDGGQIVLKYFTNYSFFPWSACRTANNKTVCNEWCQSAPFSGVGSCDFCAKAEDTCGSDATFIKSFKLSRFRPDYWACQNDIFLPVVTNLDKCSEYCNAQGDQCDICEIGNSCGDDSTKLKSFNTNSGDNYAACKYKPTNLQQCSDWCADPANDCDECNSRECSVGQRTLNIFSEGSGADWAACRKPEYGLTVRHSVNGFTADTKAARVARVKNGDKASVLFGVKNIGRNDLFKVRTYQRQAVPFQGHWEEMCTIGYMESGGKELFCEAEISVTESGLNKVVGIVQGLKRGTFTQSNPLSKQDAVRAINLTYFRVSP